jgi:hypothetical protein
MWLSLIWTKLKWAFVRALWPGPPRLRRMTLEDLRKMHRAPVPAHAMHSKKPRRSILS